MSRCALMVAILQQFVSSSLSPNYEPPHRSIATAHCPPPSAVHLPGRCSRSTDPPARSAKTDPPARAAKKLSSMFSLEVTKSVDQVRGLSLPECTDPLVSHSHDGDGNDSSVECGIATHEAHARLSWYWNEWTKAPSIASSSASLASVNCCSTWTHCARLSRRRFQLCMAASSSPTTPLASSAALVMRLLATSSPAHHDCPHNAPVQKGGLGSQWLSQVIQSSTSSPPPALRRPLYHPQST
eukprot:1175721-Prorocentrum_minimum.AAC.5